MTTFIRVRDTRTGHEVDVPQRAVRVHHEVLSSWEPAAAPRPPKHRERPAKKTAARRPAAQPTTSTETEES